MPQHRLDLPEQIGLRGDARGEAGEVEQVLEEQDEFLRQPEAGGGEDRRMRLSAAPTSSNVSV